MAAPGGAPVTPPWARLELEAVVRMAAARDAVDGMTTGEAPIDPGAVEAAARLLTVAARYLRESDARKAVAA